MLATETRRMLIGDWNPPKKAADISVVKEAAPNPDLVQTAVRVVRDGETTISGGVSYQRCGGGRRVIRKRIGGN